MPRKIQNTTKDDLISVALPNHAATYTVISHQFIIDYAYQALATAGFGIVDEEYRCTADGQIATGIYKLQFNSDPELSMMFAWTNSYNKQVKFKCVVGAYINKTGAVMISGDIGSWVRKHTGTADTETKKIIDDYITNAHMYYTQLCTDKATMEGITLNKRKQSQLLGVLFAEYEILTTEQASMIRDQMKKPYHVFVNTDSLWSFYNYVTIALQNSHPKTWMEDQRVLHYFIGTIGNFSAPVPQISAPVALYTATPIVTESEFVDPNQINLLDQITELTEDESVLLAAQYPVLEKEAFQVPDNQVVQEEVIYADDLHQSEEIIEDVIEAEVEPFDIDEDDDSVLGSLLTPCAEHDAETEREIGQQNSTSIFPQDEIVEYTDPAGNTFEAPIVIEDLIIEEKPVEETIEDEFALEDNFDLDFSEDTNEDSDSVPDFF
jgi:hypothetical protein